MKPKYLKFKKFKHSMKIENLKIENSPERGCKNVWQN